MNVLCSCSIFEGLCQPRALGIILTFPPFTALLMAVMCGAISWLSSVTSWSLLVTASCQATSGDPARNLKIFSVTPCPNWMWCKRASSAKSVLMHCFLLECLTACFYLILSPETSDHGRGTVNSEWWVISMILPHFTIKIEITWQLAGGRPSGSWKFLVRTFILVCFLSGCSAELAN